MKPNPEGMTEADTGVATTWGDAYVVPARSRFGHWLLHGFWILLLLSFLGELARIRWHPAYPEELLLFRLSFYPVAGLSLALMARAVRVRTPELFQHLVRDRVIAPAYAQDLGSWLTGRINHPMAPVFGLVTLLLSQVPVWLAWNASGRQGEDLLLHLDPAFWVLIYFAGLLTWKAAFGGRALSQLGKESQFVLRSLHPDRSGGLGPAGELCFLKSFALILLGTFCALWLLFGPAGLTPFHRLLRGGVLTSAALSLLVFFLPLWSIHRAMASQAKVIDERFDELRFERSQRLEDLVMRGDDMPAETFVAESKRIQLLDVVALEEHRSPHWPIPPPTFFKFTSSILPVAAAALRILWDIAGR